MHRHVWPEGPLELTNSDPNAYAGLGTALLWSGDVEGSVKALETASKLGLEFTRNDLFILGTAYLLADRSADAVRTLERALERTKLDVYSNAILACGLRGSRAASRCAQAGRVGEGIRPALRQRRLWLAVTQAGIADEACRALKKAGL